MDVGVLEMLFRTLFGVKLSQDEPRLANTTKTAVDCLNSLSVHGRHEMGATGQHFGRIAVAEGQE